MLIRVKVNIGSRDTDITPSLLAGQEREVDERTGARLVARGLATDITPPPPIIEAIPARPAISEAPAPEILAEEEEPHAQAERDLKTYIDKQRRKPKPQTKQEP